MANIEQRRKAANEKYHAIQKRYNEAESALDEFIDENIELFADFKVGDRVFHTDLKETVTVTRIMSQGHHDPRHMGHESLKDLIVYTVKRSNGLQAFAWDELKALSE